MSFFESLFSGAKALFGGLVTIATELVRAVFTEFDSSNLGRAATQLVTGVSKRVIEQATDLAGEERELAAKRLRDGRTTSRDLERLQEIEAERDQPRKRCVRQRANWSRGDLLEYVPVAPIAKAAASSKGAPAAPRADAKTAAAAKRKQLRP